MHSFALFIVVFLCSYVTAYAIPEAVPQHNMFSSSAVAKVASKTNNTDSFWNQFDGVVPCSTCSEHCTSFTSFCAAACFAERPNSLACIVCFHRISAALAYATFINLDGSFIWFILGMLVYFGRRVPVCSMHCRLPNDGLQILY